MMDFQLKAKILLDELNEIKLQNKMILDRANQSIILCRNLLRKFKKEIVIHGFVSVEEEIHFFKFTKQIPLNQLIYFSEIRSFEVQFPKADRESQRKFIKKKINKLNRFFLYNMDFGQYVESGHTHFDREYYTRDYLDSYHITTSKFYFQDPDFFTPRDMLLGKFKAFNCLIGFLDNRLYHLDRPLNGSKSIIGPGQKLIWPFTNTDWVELLYALQSAAKTKHINLSIIKLSKMLQQIFDFTSKDIYKTFQDIKARKNSRTLFLDLLIASLLSEIDKSDE